MQFKTRFFGLLLICAVFSLSFPLISAAQDDPAAIDKQRVQDFIEQAFNQGSVAAVDEAFAPDYISHPDELDRDGFKQQILSLRAAMPDLKASTDPILVEGEWAAFRFHMGGTFQNDMVAGPEMTIPATGKPVQIAVNIVVRVNEAGQIVEEWDGFNNLDFLMQLGAIPSPEGETTEAAMADMAMEPMAVMEMSDEVEQMHKDTIAVLAENLNNLGDPEAAKDMLAPEYIRHNPYNDYDIEGTIGGFTALQSVMPDLEITLDTVIADGDWAAAMYTTRGTFTGEFPAGPNGPVAGNGNTIELLSISLMRFNEAGQVVEEWEEFDNLDFLMQLGVLPEM